MTLTRPITALLIITLLPAFAQLALAQPATRADVAGTVAEANPSKAIGVEQVKAADHVGQQRYALIVGINEYADKRIPQLNTSENDAKALFDLLADPAIAGIPKDNLTLLLGKDATTRNVKKALNDLRKLPANSTVFVYFSGHGAKEAGEAFWVTHDSELSDLAATAIADSDTRKFLERIVSDRVIVMLDCCYAAATIKENKSVVDLTDALSKFTGKGRAILSAAGSGEEAIEARDLKHSVFTYHLLQGMRGKADANGDGVVVLPELTTYIDEHVADEARKRGGIQKPVVDLAGVQEPAKFRITIDADRLRRNLQETAEAKGLREKRLGLLKDLYLEEKLTLDQYQLGQELLSPSRELDELDRRRLTEFLAVADGKLAPDKLSRALDAIETPAQRQARMAKEALMRAELVRTAKIADLWKTALANDNKTSGKTALSALEELLKLDPNHTEAKKLQEKISGYFGPPTLDLGANVKLELVKIDAGGFQMGSELSAAEVARQFNSKAEYFEVEHPRHKVTIEKAFYLGKFEVTRGQFRQFINDSGYRTDAEKDGKGGYGWTGSEYKQSTTYSWRDAGFKQDDDHPVVNVSWNDAVAFCDWLSKKSGGKVRLPTEAQWEYAARGGKPGVFPWGNDPDDGAGWGNALDQTAKAQFDSLNTFSWRDGYVFTAPTGRFKANAFGVHDMFGNVLEWTSSKVESYPYRSTDGREEPGGTASRVLRGGCWYGGPEICRSAGRFRITPDYRSNYHGFRVVLDF